MAGAFDSALHLVFKLVHTALLFIKADLYILKISVLVSAIIAIGLELLLVIWIVKRRGEIHEISSSVAWPPW
jgi:ABC-type tungstate transport system substrate-binding protein